MGTAILVIDSVQRSSVDRADSLHLGPPQARVCGFIWACNALTTRYKTCSFRKGRRLTILLPDRYLLTRKVGCQFGASGNFQSGSFIV